MALLSHHCPAKSIFSNKNIPERKRIRRRQDLKSSVVFSPYLKEPFTISDPESLTSAYTSSISSAVRACLACPIIAPPRHRPAPSSPRPLSQAPPFSLGLGLRLPWGPASHGPRLFRPASFDSLGGRKLLELRSCRDSHWLFRLCSPLLHLLSCSVLPGPLSFRSVLRSSGRTLGFVGRGRETELPWRSTHHHCSL